MRKSPALLFLLTLLVCPPVSAATHIWTGAASDRFSDPANWIGGSPAGDVEADLSFSSGSRRTLVNDIPSLTIAWMSLTGEAWSITGAPIHVVNGTIDVTAEGRSTIGNDVIVDGQLTIGGDRELTITGRIAGAGSVLKTGSSIVEFSGTGPNSYNGITRVTRGGLRLRKPAHVAAIGGDLSVSDTGDFGTVMTLADEQLPDGARITIGVRGRLTVGAVETIGPLTVTGWGVLESTGTVFLTTNVTMAPGQDGLAELNGNIELRETRTLELPLQQIGIAVAGASGPGGLLFHGPPTADGVGPYSTVDGTYAGSTTIDGANVEANVPSSAVVLRRGAVGGTAASLIAERGIVRSMNVSGAIGLSPAVDVRVEVRGVADYVPLSAGSAVDLSGANLSFSSINGEFGSTYLLLEKRSAGPITGTFAGLPEGAVVEGRMRISYVGGDGNDITVTDVGMEEAIVTATVDETRPMAGVPFHVRAFVQSMVAHSGTVTFSVDGEQLAALPAEYGADVVAEVTLPAGVYDMNVSYSGDARHLPSSTVVRLAVSPPAPILTSVEPSVVPGGVRSRVTLRGSNFVEGTRVIYRDVVVPSTFISPTELSFDFALASAPIETVVDVAVVDPYNQATEPLPLRVTAVPEASVPVRLEDGGVYAAVTRGKDTAWMGITRAGSSSSWNAELVGDGNNDGVSHWKTPVSLVGIWAAVDVSTGQIRSAQKFGDSIGLLPPLEMPSAMFLRDPAGNYSHVVADTLNTDLWQFLWVRPGVGAWRLSQGDGGTADLDRETNGLIVFDVTTMTPLALSVPAPAGVRPGDVFVAINQRADAWYGDEVDDHLAPDAGDGVLRFAARYTGALGEGPGGGRAIIMRTGGSAGTVSVDYSMTDRTARAGIDYESRSGTLTFRPGEILKSIDVSIVDDRAYAPRREFDLTLSNPAGTTIEGDATRAFEIIDNDPRPALRLVPTVAAVDEGGDGVHEVVFEAGITNPARDPLTVEFLWNILSADRQLRQEIVFSPGETTKTVTATYLGDTIPEEGDAITAFLSIPSSEYGMGSAEVRIRDDDTATISVSDVTVVEGSGMAVVNLTSTPQTKRPVMIDYVTSADTATDGVDYEGVAGSTTISFSGDQSIFIPIVADETAEGAERFRFTITGVTTGATVSRSTALITIIDDDVATQPSGRRRSARH